MSRRVLFPPSIRLVARHCILCALSLSAAAQTQEDHPEFLFRTAPYPPFGVPPRPDYNLKWGRLSARLSGSVSAEYNDNINLSDNNPLNDLTFEPKVGIGFLFPLSEKNLLQFDLGFGYRAYVNHPELNSVQLTPDSKLSYHLRAGKAELVVHDGFNIQIDPLSRPELSGTNTVLNYKRFMNDIGLEGTYEPIKDLTVIGTYDFMIDRSISDSFKELDRNDHVFSLSAFHPLNARIVLGAGGSYTLMEYLEPIQNDGAIFSIGPEVILKLTEFIHLDGGVNYTFSDYQHTGAIDDTSNFEGTTATARIRHVINSKLNHYLRYVKTVGPGLGSNFTELQQIQYGLTLRASSSVTINSTFSHEDYDVSGFNAESGTRNIWYIGSNFRISKKWDAGLAYSFSWKDSDLPDRDYKQNRVTVSLTRHF